MRIQHNISALNASNKLKANDNAISKNIAKLSSGYRINSAADDAAGLAVSEKMRSQINGLNQAEDNAQNGISLVQTAEGGLNETESILQRMNTLATESANGTYQDATDRANLQKEVTALKSEVDRISTSTNFNQINLLDGSLSATGAAGSATSATVSIAGLLPTNTPATASTFTTGSLAVAGDVAASGTLKYTISYETADGTSKTKDITLTVDTTAKTVTDNTGHVTAGTGGSGAVQANDVATAINSFISNDADLKAAFSSVASTDTVVFTDQTKGANGESLTGITKNGTGISFTKAAGADGYDTYSFAAFGAYNGTNASSAVFTVNGQKFAFVQDGTDISKLGSDVNTVFTAGANPIAAEVASMSGLINAKTGLATTPGTVTTDIDFKVGTGTTNAKGGVTFQIGSDNKSDQRVSLTVSDMSSKGLGIDGISVATQTDAQAAIDTIKAAINTVSATRADLGALQNRLEHTSNNLSTMSENLTSAESNIRDVDMSDEYVQYSKNQILAQAATSMLAQANSQPQNVLTLLKG